MSPGIDPSTASAVIDLDAFVANIETMRAHVAPAAVLAVVKADAKTGKFAWNESVFTKPCSASPILVGDTIVAVSEDGLVAAIKTGSEFEPPAVTKLGEGCFASPAAADGKLFIRGTGHLFCIGKK